MEDTELDANIQFLNNIKEKHPNIPLIKFSNNESEIVYST